MRIGLVGEDPNDTQAVKNLLAKRYGKVHFQPLLRNLRGHQLDSHKTKRLLKLEMGLRDYHFVIFIRDLDDHGSATASIKEKQSWFSELKSKDDLLLLHIWELEALIFADIATFNKLYGCDIKFNKDPMKLPHPKEALKSKTAGSRKKYHESDVSPIFEKLDFETVRKNCGYFRDFLTEFEQKISEK